MGLGDFGAVEGAGDEGFVGAEVVDEDLAVDLRGVELGAALPEEFGLFDSPSTRRSISRPTQAALDLALIFCWSFISFLRRDSMVRLGTLSSAGRLKAAAPSSSE